MPPSLNHACSCYPEPGLACCTWDGLGACVAYFITYLDHFGKPGPNADVVLELQLFVSPTRKRLPCIDCVRNTFASSGASISEVIDTSADTACCKDGIDRHGPSS